MLIDIDDRELAKAPEGYGRIQADLCAPLDPAIGQFDMVFSRFLLEHIPRPSEFHLNVLKMLRPGGVSIHYFPTLFAPPFLVNRTVPEWLSSWLLDRFLPERDREQHGKFPAFYRWCRGPSTTAHRRFTEIGFEGLQYCGYFGAFLLPEITARRSIFTRSGGGTGAATDRRRVFFLGRDASKATLAVTPQ